MPGEEASIKASFTMHEGMEGPHLIVLPLITNDPKEPHKFVRIKVDFVNPDKNADASADKNSDVNPEVNPDK